MNERSSTAPTTDELRKTPLSAIQPGMRLRSTVSDAANEAIVTFVTPEGFAYRVPDDETVISPHWSMHTARDGHFAFAIDGGVFWEPVCKR